MTVETEPTTPHRPARPAGVAVASSGPDPATAALDVVRSYADAVFRRGRQPMTPAGFEPDWQDAPSKYKTYPGVERLAAPRRPATRLGRLPELLTAEHAQSSGPAWRADEVSALAALAYGVRDRRLAPNWNQDLHGRLHYPGAVWGRATASGGGMYPLEIYWVVGAGTAVQPGVYHYHTGQDAWQRLATGDHSGRVRAACLGAPHAERAGQFLVVSSRFWKNAFKYHDFCFHVVTQDLGALLGSWQLIARGLGRGLRPVLWFSDEPVNARLGLGGDEESVLAVVPLPGGDAPATPAVRADDVTAGAFERSRRILRLERLIAVHRATMVGDQPRPAPLPAGEQPASAGQVAGREAADAVSLPRLPAQRWAADLGDLLARRRSSFGGFTRSRRLSAAELGGVLHAAAAARDFPDDFGAAPERSPLTRLHVLVNDVDGVEAGGYTYDVPGHRLIPYRVEPTARLLQQAYFLSNYNLEQVSAVLAISARFDDALAHYGPRGYRLVNAEAGAVAQVANLAAAGLEVGCGAVLGLNNELIDEALGIAGTPLRTVLFVLLGHDRAGGGISYPVAPWSAAADSVTSGRTS